MQPTVVQKMIILPAVSRKNKGLRVMVFNTTCNNISVIWWWSVLLMEKTKVRGDKHRPVLSHYQTLSHNVVLITPSPEWGSN